MSNSGGSSHTVGVDQPGIYRILIKGRLDESWSQWFGGLNLTTEQGPDGSSVTCLTGRIVDQPALHSVLSRVRDLGLTLLLVELVEPD